MDISVTNERTVVTIAANDETTNVKVTGEANFKNNQLSTVNLDMTTLGDKPVHLGSANYGRDQQSFFHTYADKEESLELVYRSTKAIIDGLQISAQ